MAGSVLGENVDIPIVLGESLLSNASSPFWTVRYHFKPASVAKSGEGLLEVDRESQTVSLAGLRLGFAMLDATYLPS